MALNRMHSPIRATLPV